MLALVVMQQCLAISRSLEGTHFMDLIKVFAMVLYTLCKCNLMKVARKCFFSLYFTLLFSNMEASKSVLDSVVKSPLAGVEEVVPAAVDNLAELSQEVVSTTLDVKGVSQQAADHNTVIGTSGPITQTSLDVSPEPTDTFYSCAYEVGLEEKNITKLVYLSTFQWTNQANFYILGALQLPRTFFRDSSMPGRGQAGYFKLIRCGFDFKIECNAPYGVAGALVIFYVPPPYSGSIQESKLFDDHGLDQYCIFNFPHAILDVAYQNEVTLTVPYIHHSNYAELSFNNEISPPMGKLVIAVLSQARFPLGATNLLDVTVLGRILDADFQCPRVNQGRVLLPNNKPKIQKPQSVPAMVNIAAGAGTFNGSNSQHLAIADSGAIGGETVGVDFASAGAVCSETDFVDVVRKWTIISNVETVSYTH